jgi:hypothetical protein
MSTSCPLSEPPTPVDFRSSALAHIARGFAISATRPESKEGFHGWNTYNLLIDAAGVDRFLAKNPQCVNSNVAVCASCAMHYDNAGKLKGNLLVLDIDTGGVIEQILTENPRKHWPKTYTVQTRPTTNPAKVHVYFRHTNYSMAAFKRLGGGVAKEISAMRDLSKPVDERGLHPNRYDLKGSGAGGFVVGDGGLHDNGERYTAQNDFPVINIPNWLIDWLVQDVLKYRSALAAKRQQSIEHRKQVLALPARKRSALQRENNPDGFIISKENTYAFLRAKARFLATKGGLPTDLIQEYLGRAAVAHCHDGEAFVASDSGKRAIEHIIEFVVVDENQSWLESDYESLDVEPTTTIDTDHGITIATPDTSRSGRLMNIGQDFGPIVSSDEVYRAFDNAVGFPRTNKNRQLLGRVMRNLGYKCDRFNGKANDPRYWRRV